MEANQRVVVESHANARHPRIARSRRHRRHVPPGGTRLGIGALDRRQRRRHSRGVLRERRRSVRGVVEARELALHLLIGEHAMTRLGRERERA
jgi:hypothetical protein